MTFPASARDVWIGQDVTLARGISLGNGCVVAAKSVVTKSVPPYAIVGGNPAKVIRMRFAEDMVERLLASQWWDYSFVDFGAMRYDEPALFLDELAAAVAAGTIRPFHAEGVDRWRSGERRAVERLSRPCAGRGQVLASGPSCWIDPLPTSVKPSVLDAIGDTPLIRLNRASDATGCEIWGKAEFMNPGQSVKDRAALAIIRDAEKRGLLRPGGLIVEGTAGNTGIGLAMVASALGYRAAIVIPRTQSQEKKDAIRLLGAELIEGRRRPLFQSRQLCPLFRPPGRRARAGRA